MTARTRTHVHTHRSVAVAFVMLLLAQPAFAGDDFESDWGISTCDDRIVLYLGSGRQVMTPIPAPPRGPRWDVMYPAMSIAGVAAAASWFWWRLRWRSDARRGSAFEVRLASERSPSAEATET